MEVSETSHPKGVLLVYKLFAALNSLLGRVISLGILVVLGVAGWVGYRAYYGDKLALEDAVRQLAQQKEQMDLLRRDLEAKQREIERLATAMRLLKVDRRIAQIDVLGQSGSAEKGDLNTKFTFVEVDEQGKPLDEPRTFSVQGDVLYVDGWVLKFDDDLVESNDPLRSASLFLFRRLFGEKQRPEDGFSLDPVGSEPAPYRTAGKAKMSEFERGLWGKFWQYANDAALAKKERLRAAHGDAVYMKLQPGKRYRVQLRASDGVTFKVEDSPARTPGPSL
mgnify:CR=1 FL=1